MKNILLLFLTFLAFQTSNAQDFKVKDSLVSYFDQHKNNLDPIEGIWMLNVKNSLYVNDTLNSFSEDLNRSEWAIVKETNLRFKVISVATNNDKQEFNAYFEKTAVEGLYTYECYFKNPDWIAKSSVRLDEGTFLKYGYYVSKVHLDKTFKDVPHENYELFWGFNWVKKYPADKKITEGYHNEWKKGIGTGFFIDNTGYVATNYHVIVDAKDIEIQFYKDNSVYAYTTEIVAVDKINDLAILKVLYPETLEIPIIPYQFLSETQEVGTQVFALGYPLIRKLGADVKFTDGRISSTNGYKNDPSEYQTTTPLQFGNSGGPLFDFKGNLVGVNKSILTPDFADNVSFSVKGNYLLKMMETIPEITIPKSNLLSQMTLNEKIKELSKLVVQIKVMY